MHCSANRNCTGVQWSLAACTCKYIYALRNFLALPIHDAQLPSWKIQRTSWRPLFQWRTVNTTVFTTVHFILVENKCVWPTSFGISPPVCTFSWTFIGQKYALQYSMIAFIERSIDGYEQCVVHSCTHPARRHYYHIGTVRHIWIL